MTKPNTCAEMGLEKSSMILRLLWHPSFGRSYRWCTLCPACEWESDILPDLQAAKQAAREHTCSAE